MAHVAVSRMEGPIPIPPHPQKKREPHVEVIEFSGLHRCRDQEVKVELLGF